MSKDKAIVLEKNEGFYLVLDSGGSFRRVRSRFKAEVGEEIEVNAYQSLKNLRVLISVAAIILLTLVSTLGWSSWQTPVAVAMLSVDINPSLEISLDKSAHIIRANAKNQDAVQLLQGVEIKGQTITVAIDKLVTRAVELHFLNAERKWIVLGISEGTGEKTSKPSDHPVVDSQAILSGLNGVVASKGLGLQVVIFKLTPKEGQKAQNAGLSLGEYALWQAAEKVGHSVPPQTLKSTTDRSKLLEAPAVQAELKHNRNMIDTGAKVERPNKEIKSTPIHGRNGVEDKLPNMDKLEKEKVKLPITNKLEKEEDKIPTKDKSEKHTSSVMKLDSDSDFDMKPGNGPLKRKIDDMGQLKRGFGDEKRHINSKDWKLLKLNSIILEY